MNLNQAPQPTERVGIGKRISDLWNSRNRIAKLIILATTGLVLNCCCVIIPLSSKAHSLPAQSNVGVNAISTPAFPTAQDPFIPTALAISANTEFDNNGDEGLSARISTHRQLPRRPIGRHTFSWMQAIRMGALANHCHELKKSTMKHKQKVSLFCGRLLF